MQYAGHIVPVVVGIVVLATFGLIDAIVELRRLGGQLRFTAEYQRHWITYFDSLRHGQPARDDYIWLAERQARMTAELGTADRIDYRPPFSQYMISNYPALSNTLAAARGGRGAHEDMVAFVDHLLISRGGALKERYVSVLPKLKNPVFLVGRGLRLLIGLPLSFLAWSGLLLPATAEGARQSWVFRVAQLVAAIVVAAAGVVTLVVGWSEFVKQLRAWFPWLP